MNRRSLLAFALPATLAATLAAAGCGSSDSPGSTPGAGPGASFPVTAGGLTLDRRPTHVVSLSPTATEMLFAIGAGSQVTAVDDQSNYPADAPKSDLSGYKPNAEAIAAKSPDLVVLSDDTNKIKDQLTALKIPVYLAPAASTLEDTYGQLATLGTLTGHPADAAAEVQRMKADIAKIVKDVKARATPLTYYYELSPDFYSATSKAFIGSVIAATGLKNIADAADADGKAGGYPQLAAESIVAASPDLVFLADTKCCQQSVDTVKTRAGWGTVKAVQKGQVVALDDDVASRWGPRVVDLLRQVVDAANAVPAT
jgi:iron complex transport system substrate-binding protein